MELSGNTLPNNLVAAILHSLDELMGTNGLNSVLNAAGLQEWIKQPPAPNEERDVDFSQFSALFRTLEDLYGQKGSQSLMRRVNTAVFDQVWSGHRAFEDIESPETQELEADSQIERGLTALANALCETSDILAKVDVGDSGRHFSIERCPYCWNADGDLPQCYAFQGLLERAVLHFAPDSKVEIEEIACIGAGDSNCMFTIILQS